MKRDAYERFVIFGGKGELPDEELLGRCSDYGRVALRYYQRGRLLRAIFWAAMAAAASSFEAAYLTAQGTRTRAGQVRRREGA